MKKIVIATIIALSAASASALEVGINSGRNYSNTNSTSYGITVGKQFGATELTGGFDRTTKSSAHLDRYSLVAGRNIATVGPATVALKAGGAYLDNQNGADGFALVVGTGVTVPLTKTVSATVDYSYQRGQQRVQSSNGNLVTAGLKFSF